MIDLDVEELKSIVKDGIREMMNHVAGRSQNAKKRVWVVAVKVAIKEYQRKIVEEFFLYLSGISVDQQFSNSKMAK